MRTADFKFMIPSDHLSCSVKSLAHLSHITVSTTCSRTVMRYANLVEISQVAVTVLFIFGGSRTPNFFDFLVFTEVPDA